MSDPLVSICIPTYNRAEGLRRTLAAIRGWTYGRLEVLVSDNGSTDHTERVGREAEAADPRVRYVGHPDGLGLYGNHNFCSENTTGDFLSIIHDHDQHDSTLVNRLAGFLDEHPDVGVVSGDWAVIDEAGHTIGGRDHPGPDVRPGLAYIEQTLRSGRSFIGLPGAMIRRKALGNIRFNERGPIGFKDFAVWCQIAEEWAVGHVPVRLSQWRLEQTSLSARKIVSMADDYWQVCDEYCAGYLERHPGEAARVGRWRRWIRQYLFWALAYEVALYCRSLASPGARAKSPTMFEAQGYQLSQDEFESARRQLRTYRTGALQGAALLGIEWLLDKHVTRPLAWATYHHTAVRNVLGLR